MVGMVTEVAAAIHKLLLAEARSPGHKDPESMADWCQLWNEFRTLAICLACTPHGLRMGLSQQSGVSHRPLTLRRIGLC